MELMQLALRHDIERFLEREGARIHGSGTDLVTKVMDISFDIDGTDYRLELRGLN